MSVTYRETFRIGSDTYGIEDHEQPGEHFFPEERKQRFRTWHNGCGVDWADSMYEARTLIHADAVSQARMERAGHHERVVRAQRVLDRLGDDPFNLAKFM
jgi:hypothetical protein